MLAISSRLRAFLDGRGVPYRVLHHPLDYTAQQTAADTDTPGREFAKAVILKTDDRHVMVILPAHHRINFGRLREALDVTRIRLAAEEDLERLFPDCAVGAEPPFGNLYDVPVYMSETMADDESITFNAGTHEDVIRMSHRDFVELVRPVMLSCSDPR